MSLDLRNVVVNLKALAVTSAAVDACKLALAVTTLVRMQPNRGYVFLAALGAWSIVVKILVVCASMAGYALVFWGVSKGDKRLVVAAAVIFAISIVFRCLFMFEGAFVIVQDDISAMSTATTVGLSPTGAGLYFAHQQQYTTSVSTDIPVISAGANPLSTAFRIIQVNLIHACSVAVHIIFFIVIRKYMRCTKYRLRPGDVLVATRT